MYQVVIIMSWRMADRGGMDPASALGQTYAKLGYPGMNGEGVGRA